MLIIVLLLIKTEDKPGHALNSASDSTHIKLGFFNMQRKAGDRLGIKTVNFFGMNTLQNRVNFHPDSEFLLTSLYADAFLCNHKVNDCNAYKSLVMNAVWGRALWKCNHAPVK